MNTPLSPHAAHLALELHQQPPLPPLLSGSNFLNEETRQQSYFAYCMELVKQRQQSPRRTRSDLKLPLFPLPSP
jgi:hypothetical protein